MDDAIRHAAFTRRYGRSIILALVRGGIILGGYAILDIKTFARLCSVSQSLTPAQRAQLMSIVECSYQQLKTPIWESLAALGLVRLDGNKYIATEDGRYVATLR